MTDLWATDKKVTPRASRGGMLESQEVNRAAYASDMAAAFARKNRRRTIPGTLERIDLTNGSGDDRDEVLVLRIKNASHFPGKRIRLDDTGDIEIKGYAGGGWFAGLALMVDGIDSLHTAFVRVCEQTDGAGVTVRGGVADGADPRSMTRCKKHKLTVREKGVVIQRGKPRGLVDVARRWAIMDVDKVPNIWKLDPRINPVAVVLSLRKDLFPAELHDVRMSWQMSSSMCVCVSKSATKPLPIGTPPELLSMHLRVWLDRPVAERELSSILARLRKHVENRLVALDTEPGAVAAVIDAAAAVFNQAIYSVRPDFGNQVADPFPGSDRYGLLPEGRDAVRVDELVAQLPVLASTPRRTMTAEQKEQAVASMQRGREARRVAKQAAVIAEPLPPLFDAVPFDTAPEDEGPVHRLLTNLEVALLARAEVFERKRKGMLTNKLLFRMRALRDIVKVVADRKAKDAVWRASDGVPEGLRSRVMYAVGSLLSWTLAQNECNIGAHVLDLKQLRTGIREYAERLVSMTWFEAEWIATAADTTLFGRAREAKTGWLRGTKKNADAFIDSRPDPGKARLIDLLDISSDEMLRLELEALRTPSIGRELARRAAGMSTLAERREREATCSDKATRPWEQAGISKRTWHRVKVELIAELSKPLPGKPTYSRFIRYDAPSPQTLSKRAVIAAPKLMLDAVNAGVALNVALLVSQYHRVNTPGLVSVGTGATVAAEAQHPWEQAGISRRTWFRKQSAERKAWNEKWERGEAPW